MKQAEISPLFKPKDDIIKDNYRSISLLEIVSKVFETIVAELLMEYVMDIFDPMLCAYRKKYGTEHVLIKLLDSCKYALNNDNFDGTDLIDLSKDFDCIPYGLLITNQSASEFMASYLSERYQRVKISNTRSSSTPVLKGKPQCSCFGPFIFNVYMNDIFSFIEICDLANYADDNTLDHILSTIETVLSALQKDTANNIKWFEENYMQANPVKLQLCL